MTFGPAADVVVAGGGPGGAAAAISLARAGANVTVLAPERPVGRAMCESVPSDIRDDLATLGAWDGFVADYHEPSGGVGSAWGGPDIAWQDGFADPRGHGWHVDRRRFDETLLREAERRGATVLRPARVTGVESDLGSVSRVVVAMPSGSTRTLTAAAVIDASGRGAVVARGCGHGAVRVDHLTCVSGRLRARTRDEFPDRMIVEAVRDGWWWAAREPDGTVAAAFFSDADVVRELGAHRGASWQRLLRETSHLSTFVEGMTPASEPATMSAATQIGARLHGPGWLAVGDAASAWDPLTSAGVVTAIRSGVEGAAAVLRSLDGEQDAAHEYDRRTRSAFARYLVERAAYYALETRWPESPFWRRRAVVAAPVRSRASIGRAGAPTT